MQKLNKELNDNKKLSESKYAKEVLKLIAFLTTQPIETIEMICGDIKGFDQEQLKVAIESDKKTLKEFGEYVYFIASKEQKDNSYCMAPNEISTNVFEYFTDNLNKDWIKKLADDKKASEKSKKDKEERELKAKEAKEKADADKLFIETLKIEDATEQDLERYCKIKGIDYSEVDKKGHQEVLFEEDRLSKIKTIIVNYSNKKIKHIKHPKKAVKKEVKGEQIELSLFDL